MQNNTDWLYCHTQIRWESLRNFFPSFEWKPARDNYVNHNVKYLHFCFPGIVTFKYFLHSVQLFHFMLSPNRMYYWVILWVIHLYIPLISCFTHLYTYNGKYVWSTYHILCFCIVFENLNVSICIRKMEGF